MAARDAWRFLHSVILDTGLYLARVSIVKIQAGLKFNNEPTPSEERSLGLIIHSPHAAVKPELRRNAVVEDAERPHAAIAFS